VSARASAAEALREAGAILPGKATKDRTVDAFTARAYTHPALDARVVVRLVPATLGEAEDLGMEFLGFAAEGRPATVGHGRRQALGFPAWALVNDPANGRHALALVKDMARLARVAMTKPGNAKDGYEALANRLGAAAPHFLPTFWEEAGRAFLAAENAKMAGTCFAAARQAEQVHGLAVDEDRLREVHLEFALAGALTAKAVTEYARQVATRRPAAEAYELVRTIAARRVAGGLPPYVGLAEDLKRLAKAAGLDPEEQAAAMVAELLTYPAVTKAHEGFWKSYRPTLVRLAKKTPAVRGRLLAIMPDPPGYDADPTTLWLDLLAAAGAIDVLHAPDKAPADARPTDGVAGWVQRFLDFRHGGWRHRNRAPLWLDLFTKLVDRVRAELLDRDATLRLSRHRWSAPDLDVLDICLEAGVPIAYEPHASGPGVLPLNHWLSGPDQGRRDLAAVAADARFLPALVSSLRSELGAHSGDDSHQRRQAAAGNAAWRLEPVGLRTAATAWLTDLARDLDSEPTIITLSQALDSVAPLWSPGGVRLSPEAFTRLADTDVAEALARSLRGGLPVELTWPEYEQVHADFSHADLKEAWPAIVLSDRQRAILVGPEGVLDEHAIRLPAKTTVGNTIQVSYVDDQFWVHWYGGGYWSGRPTEILETRRHRWAGGGWYGWPSLALPTGGRTTGQAPWRAGDSEVPEWSHIASDGVSYWRLESVQSGQSQDRTLRWREYDPATGAPGRHSRPGFFDEPLADGDVAEENWAYLMPAPDAIAGSPLGWRDGLVGWRVVRHPDGRYTGTAIDGSSVTWQPPQPIGQMALAGALRLPGDDRPRPVTSGRVRSYSGGPEMVVWDVDGRQMVSRQEVGQYLPPRHFWHALRPRDAQGSAALRSIDPATAARLLDACTTAEPTGLRSTARRAVGEVLPDITDRVLIKGVAIAVAAAESLRRLQTSLRALLSDESTDQAPVTAPLAAVTADDMHRALSELVGRYGYYRGYGRVPSRAADQIAAAGAVLAGTAKDYGVERAEPTWLAVMPWLGAVVVRAASPVTADADRAVLRGLLASVPSLGLAGTDPRVRLVRVSRTGKSFTDAGFVYRSPVSTMVILDESSYHQGATVTYRGEGIQLSPTGEFDLPAALQLDEETRFTGWGDLERVAAAVNLLDRGAAPWRAERVDDLIAATGMSRAEATLLLAGMPRVTSWEANFLTADERALLGLKAADAKVARDVLRDIPPENRRLLLEAAMPTDPEQLWSSGPDVDGLARQWIEMFGRAVPLPADLVTEADRVLHVRNASDFLQAIAAPRPGDWLHTDGRPGGQRTNMVADGGQAFDQAHLRALGVALPWLAYRLPAGDPIRAGVPAAHQLVLERLRNKELLVGHTHLRRASVPDGLAALVEGSVYGEYAYYHLRPEALSGVDDPALAFIDDDTRACLALLLSDSFAQTLASVAADPTPPGRYPHDPTVSVADLVDEVATAHGLSTEAAGYYLQLLALPDPTDKRVLEWNGWNATKLRAARAALTATDLVVEAKRERAGRGLFLPGGWLPLKAPNLPIEAWKQGLGLGVDGTLPSGRVLVTVPVADLFRTAWARVVGGDPPRYQSLSEAR
jgi:hypothetical protein